MVLIGSLVVEEEMDILPVVVEELVLRHLHMLVLELVFLDHLEIQVVLDLLIQEVVVVRLHQALTELLVQAVLVEKE